MQNMKKIELLEKRLSDYLGKTKTDKYEYDNFSPVLLAKRFKLSPFIFSMVKYIFRYSATEGEKNGNIKDLFKAIHYMTFEKESPHPRPMPSQMHDIDPDTIGKVSERFLEYPKLNQIMINILMYYARVIDNRDMVFDEIIGLLKDQILEDEK